MLTARLAVEAHGRECWAVPAEPDRREARGGLEAIRDGWAACVIEPADVLADVMARLPMRSGVCESGADGQPVRPPLGEVESKVVQSLRRGGRAVGSMVDAIGGPPGPILRAVTTLEMSGVLRRVGERLTLSPAGLEVAAAIRRGGAS
jgi:predicted Rossmann fold nucleotide-binding protein DprA/Smf involved in DNA uptake